MSEIRVTNIIGENGSNPVGLSTGFTVGPTSGTTGIGVTITHHGNASFTGVCTATSYEATTFSKTPTNTPAFHAWSNNVTSHSIADSTFTKVTFLNSETFDTDNAYDLSLIHI